MTEIDDIKVEIDTIDSNIEGAKQERAESEGAIKTYMKQLKDDHSITSKAKAKEFISQGKEELAVIESEIKSDFAELKDRCGL